MKPLKLAPEEIAIVTMMRRNAFQEIIIQVQDGVITSVNQIQKFRRKKGGGLVSGIKSTTIKPPLKLSAEEITIIKKLRSNSFQQLTIDIRPQDDGIGVVEVINQTLKFRRKGGDYK
jgi:hypothetical protein